MKSTISFSFDSRSLAEAIRQVREYRAEFVRRCDEVVSELANQGYTVIYDILSDHVFDGATLASLRVQQLEDGEGNRFVVSAQSEAILILEFGSGLPAQRSPHPDAAIHNMGAGTLSEKGHWNQPGGWYYPTNDPRLITKYSKDGTQGYGHTKGMTPQMPFYKAAREIERSIEDAVRRVFA